MFLFLDRHKNIIHFWKLKSVVFYNEVERENRQREKKQFLSLATLFVVS